MPTDDTARLLAANSLNYLRDLNDAKPEDDLLAGHLSRRRFLAAGGGVALAAVAVPAVAQTTPGSETPRTGNPPRSNSPASPPPPPPPGSLLPPLKMESISAPTEREQENAPTAVPFNRRMGVAVVGLGRLSLEAILPAFAKSERVKVTALVSGDRAKALQVAQQYGVKETSIYDYKTFDRLRDDAGVDFVYIVLPNSQHHEFTLRAAAAGKHVLCEKPMANTPKEADEMVAACRAANRKLQIAYRIQYEPHHNALRRAIVNHEFGDIKLIDSVNGQNQGGDLNQWRLKKALAGGGSLPDVGLYCLNTIRFLTGEEPIEIGGARVYSTPGDPRFREVEETVSWLMRFPSGVEAMCATSYGWHETRRLQVMASAASAEMSPAFSYHNIRLTVTRKSSADPKAESREERIYDEKDQFALEMDAMARAIALDRTPWTPGEEGAQDMRLMARIYEAAQSGRTITLPPAPKPRDAFRGDPPV